ncbi:RluA family pseudouridine synthase [Candidatus Thioglobus sp.]|uniref:RluA family pseudouridine synthase n=1 Tax=Candidatus Thioglobus sp. TaxID=2026721 RepID=UPI003D0D2EDB
MIERKITIKTNHQLLIDALVESTGLSKQVLKSALDKGCVWLKANQKVSRIRRVKKPLKIGDEVFIYFNEKILASTATQPTLLLDKKDYSIWFKPAGVYSQGSKWADHCTLTRLVEKLTDRPTFLVHRLDRATSGLMILAHTKTMARAFSRLFAQRSIKKSYLAVVEGDFPFENISLDADIDEKNALSHITKLAHNEQNSLLKIRIETGRKHQIRKHLSQINFPIIGDRLHGNADKNFPKDLQLQAISLKFICPIDAQEVDFRLAKNQEIML